VLKGKTLFTYGRDDSVRLAFNCIFRKNLDFLRCLSGRVDYLLVKTSINFTSIGSSMGSVSRGAVGKMVHK